MRACPAGSSRRGFLSKSSEYSDFKVENSYQQHHAETVPPHYRKFVGIHN